MYNIGRACRPGSVWCTKLPGRPPHGGIEYRTRGRRRTKTVHRTGPGRTPAGRQPGAVRCTCSSDGARKLTARHLYGVYGLLMGALRLHSTNFTGHRPGAVQYVTTHAVEMKIVRDPYIRSLKSTASRRVGKIVRGPVDMWPRHTQDSKRNTLAMKLNIYFKRHDHFYSRIFEEFHRKTGYTHLCKILDICDWTYYTHKEYNKKICDSFDHNFKSIPLYKMSYIVNKLLL